MSEMLPSLLSDDEKQGALFSVPATIAKAMEAEGAYTAERFFSRHPERYAAVAKMLAAGMGPRPINRAMKQAFGEGIDRRTIDAVAQRERIAIPTLNEQIVQGLSLLVADSVDVLREKVESAKPGELAMIVGVAFDKLQLATGGATQRIEVTDPARDTGVESFEAWLEKQKAAETGSATGEKIAKGAVVEIGAGLDTMPVDCVSGALLCDFRTDTTSDTEKPHDLAAIEPLPGGAVGPSAAGGFTPTDSCLGNFPAKAAPADPSAPNAPASPSTPQ